MVKGISVLGSTGSIGTQSLAVAEHLNIPVYALAAGENVELLFEQVWKYTPKIVSVRRISDARALYDMIRSSSGLSGLGIEVVYGSEGAKAVACAEGAEMVVAAISGAAGLEPILAAIEAEKSIALANKETMVMAGRLVMRKIQEKGLTLIPVDSEHCAIFQCLSGNPVSSVNGLILTASGGPFREFEKWEMKLITPKQAINHPVWKMGAKISIDSADMMNKGLEVIEAARLFEVDADQIHVLVHPQSIVHSMVEFRDGSVIAQLGIPDMRIPIQYAMTWPDKVESGTPPLNLASAADLHFEQPDMDRFPCLALAYDALRCGGTMPTVLNAANEIAVKCFVRGMIRFTDIPILINKVMEKHIVWSDDRVEDVLDADREARTRAREIVKTIRNGSTVL